jgi:uncharacterized membrane protein
LREAVRLCKFARSSFDGISHNEIEEHEAGGRNLIAACIHETILSAGRVDSFYPRLHKIGMKEKFENTAPEHGFHLRFHFPYCHLYPVFGNDWFALKAEAFARFFGTPTFLLAQTFVVAVWIALNVTGVTHFDAYPFVLLNLAFSLQSAYAAPLILLAQTRQADRDKAHADADARHREALALASAQRDEALAHHAAQMNVLLRQNTELTRLTRDLTEQIARLTQDVHEKITREKHAKGQVSG